MPGFASAAAALLAATSLTAAQPFSAPMVPRIRVPSGERPIEIAALDVEAVIHGLHAETTETVTFFNPNGRVLEGDLEFPLPDGATVCGFGLDVAGQIVDGVVVGKDQARVILESEVRRGVDPGLVEQVRGNLHRARIYPIPARGTRTVRLRWASDLTTRGREAAYHLPLPYDKPIGRVAMRLEVVQAPVAPDVTGGFGDLTLGRRGDRWVAEARFADAVPRRDLLVRLAGLPAELVAVEPGEGSEAFFSVSAALPGAARRALPAPRRIAVAWDASGSRAPEATDRELAFLERLLATWPHVAVDLVVFRDRPEAPAAFSAGERARLFSSLRAAPVDGGTGLAALDLRRAASPSRDDALWILFSDGIGTMGESPPRHGGLPVWTVSGAGVADRPLLRHLAAATGGEHLDLAALDAAGAAAAMTAPRMRLLRVEPSGGAGAVADLQIARRADRGRVTVAGRLLARETELTLAFGAGAFATEVRRVKLRRTSATPSGDGPGPISIAWARARVDDLSFSADANGEALLALGRRFGLVSARTSLLVLETLAQYVEHQVEPPATRPELRRQYLARMGEAKEQKAAAERNQLERVVSLWRERVRWWEEEHRVPPGWRWSEPSTRRSRSLDLAGRASEAMERPAPAAPAPFVEMSRSEPGAGRAQVMARAKRAEAQDAAGGPADEAGSAEAAIAIAPWDPAAPYLKALRRAAPGAAYAAYLAERARSASPAFFLDCADFFLRRGERLLGVRILSNLAELRIDDPALLRVMAWRLSQAGELGAAADVLERVLRLRPEAPQSKRDLALVLADLAEAAGRPAGARRAVDLLCDVVLRPQDRFPEIELVALMELNRVLARAERRGWAGSVHAERVDRRLRKLLDVDLRVSLSWDADMTDVDLHVLEPTGEHAFYGHRLTRVGGLVSHDITQGYGPEEYLVRRAAPGRYDIRVHYFGSRQQTLVGPATMTATVFTNWGRPDERREVLTLRLDCPRDMERVGVVTIGARGPASGALEPARKAAPPGGTGVDGAPGRRDQPRTMEMDSPSRRSRRMGSTMESSRGCAASRALKVAIPRSLGSFTPASRTTPPRITLSAMSSVPARETARERSRYSG
jgi:Ca-activated chloride channel family protein